MLITRRPSAGGAVAPDLSAYATHAELIAAIAAIPAPAAAAGGNPVHIASPSADVGPTGGTVDVSFDKVLKTDAAYFSKSYTNQTADASVIIKQAGVYEVTGLVNGGSQSLISFFMYDDVFAPRGIFKTAQRELDAQGNAYVYMRPGTVLIKTLGPNWRLCFQVLAEVGFKGFSTNDNGANVLTYIRVEHLSAIIA